MVKGVKHPVLAEYAKRIHDGEKNVFLRVLQGRFSPGEKFVIYDSYGQYRGRADIVSIQKMPKGR